MESRGEMRLGDFFEGIMGFAAGLFFFVPDKVADAFYLKNKTTQIQQTAKGKCGTCNNTLHTPLTRVSSSIPADSPPPQACVSEFRIQLLDLSLDENKLYRERNVAVKL